MDISVVRRAAVEAAAQLVLHSNIACWKSAVEDDAVNYPFSKYGTDPETVSNILKDMVDEVSDLVTEMQAVIKPEVESNDGR